MNYILHLSILLVVAKLLEWLFEKKDIHPIIAHILTGIILGPFLLGIIYPNEELKVLSEFGLIMMMLYMGLTSNFSAIAQNKVKAIVVASLGVAFSFILGFTTVYLFGKGISAALFVGITLGNTAIEVTSGVIMKERIKREISSVLMGAAFADDIIAVYLIGILTGMIKGQTSLLSLAILTIKIVAFILSVLIFSEFVFKKSSLIYNLVIKDLNVFFTFTIILTFSLAVIAEGIGLNRIIGAYLAGLTISRLRERKDPLIISRIKLNELINELQVVLTEFFIPLFFIYVGLMFDPDTSEINLLLIALLYASAILGKLIGCGLGVKVFKGSWKDAVIVGIGMGGRGSLDLALLKFGLESGMIGEDLFATTVIVSMLTALSTPIFFRKTVKKLSEE
ncbi:cation:proton antiporter [Pyrococcus furiosus DSM 3638]|uniref:Cation:proton antiporter n=3 Tax=Pyrococcus furiosus TaxID=2261 RepID=A0A5C0XP97_PYRFU|nr:cation:proton antiporter [Pyrococcus furiosus]AAL81288.1 putative Na+/H+ antiporter [Pyrococcus furiosus DSM 3638]AFN03955.1 Na+/H+ antiporter [Pyrococcus furiosus COM1]QEK78817.1 cation:proton antiporter [Pyrococcus furiosus DSM 3638]